MRAHVTLTSSDVSNTSSVTSATNAIRTTSWWTTCAATLCACQRSSQSLRSKWSSKWSPTTSRSSTNWSRSPKPSTSKTPQAVWLPSRSNNTRTPSDSSCFTSSTKANSTPSASSSTMCSRARSISSLSGRSSRTLGTMVLSNGLRLTMTPVFCSFIPTCTLWSRSMIKLWPGGLCCPRSTSMRSPLWSA